MSAGEIMPPVGDDFGGKYWHDCDGCGRLLFSDDSCGCRHEIPAEDQAPGWVFHNLETGTVDGVGADSWLLDVDTLTADELRHLHDADSLGWFDTGADEIVRARGVAMSEVLDALAIVRRLDAAGLMGQVLDALAAEEEDDEEDEWTDCNDDGGAVCNAAAGFPCSACAAAREVKA